MSDSLNSSAAVAREERPGAYARPEDPPQFGDDGLGFLNPSGAAGGATRNDNVCLDDDVAARGSDDDVLVKKAPQAGKDVTVGTRESGSDDFKEADGSAGFVDPFTTERQRHHDLRAERVNRRRSAGGANLVLKWIIPYGGAVSTAFNLASSTIGAGVIAMPVAFRTSGVVLAVVYLVVIGLLTMYSFTLLTILAEKTGIYNWQHMTRRLLGRGADYILLFLMWFLCFGGDVSYVLSTMGVLSAFLNNAESTPQFFREKGGQQLVTSIVWLFAMVPLCIPKEINSLRYFSAIAILFIIFFVICMVVHSGQSLAANGVPDEIVLVQNGNTAISGLSIFFFGYISQVNVFHTLEEAHKPSVRYMFWASLLGVGTCFLVYFFSGLFGYLDFGNNLAGSVLGEYNPIKQPIFAVSYVGLLLKLCVGYALHMCPIRDATYYVAGTEVSKVPYWVNTLVVLGWAALTLIGGLFIPRITTVFGLLGGICGASIGFIFPALLRMYCGGFTLQKVGWFHYLATYLLLIAGVVGFFFGTISTIYDEVLANQ